MKNSKKNFILMFLFASNALIHAEDFDDLPENTQEEAQEMAQENAQENEIKDLVNEGTSVEAVYEDPSTEELNKSIDSDSDDLSNQSTDADLSSSSNADIQSESIENPAQNANNNILTRIGRSKSTDDVKDDLENPIQNPKTHEEMISHIFRVAPQATQSEIEMVEHLFKSDNTARIFFIWSAGVFGSVRQAFIGGSKEEQDKFFAKIRRILAVAKNLNTSNNKKLVFELILDESTLKNAQTEIEKIKSEFPGSLHVEIMEKLAKRITQAAESNEKPTNSGTETPLFSEEMPLEKRFDLSFLNSPATYENKYKKGENTSNQTLLSFLKDKVIPNALNGNPALSSDVLRIVLLNDQRFDWNIYCDVDTFNASSDQLETFLSGKTDPNEAGVFFPESTMNIKTETGITTTSANANDIILGYRLDHFSNDDQNFQKLAQYFLENITKRNSIDNGIYDLFDVYRDQMSQIKYLYPDEATQTGQEPQTDAADQTVPKSKTAVEKAVDAYIERLEAYGKKIDQKNELPGSISSYDEVFKSSFGKNVAEEVLYTTGPGRMGDLESQFSFVSPIGTRENAASSQSWIEGKLTRLANPAKGIRAHFGEKAYQAFALLLLLDDLPLLQKTKDFQFLKALLKEVQTQWGEVILSFIPECFNAKTKVLTKSYLKLLMKFIDQYIKPKAPEAVRNQWDDFIADLTNLSVDNETLYNKFKSVIDWGYQVIQSDQIEKPFWHSVLSALFTRSYESKALKDHLFELDKIKQIEKQEQQKKLNGLRNTAIIKVLLSIEDRNERQELTRKIKPFLDSLSNENVALNGESIYERFPKLIDLIYQGVKSDNGKMKEEQKAALVSIINQLQESAFLANHFEQQL